MDSILLRTRIRMSVVVALLATVASRANAETPSYPPPAEVKAAFLKLLDRPRVPLDVKLESRTTEPGLIIERLSFASERKVDGSLERVPTLIVRPEKGEGKMPAVIVLHGTGGAKEGQRGWLNDLARHGMIGVAIDARYHGARSGGAGGSKAYVAAITRAWETPKGKPHEHPFYYDTAWDLWRLVDYLETRDDVDSKRIGMIGFSMGGIQTWLAASVDDRVKVSVPAIAVQSFRWSLDHEQWQGRARTIGGSHQAAAKDLGEPQVNARVCRELWNKVIPGMLGEFDCPSMIRLFAPRPLLIVSGDSDPNCPLAGAKIAFEEARAAYKSAGAESNVVIDVAEKTAHRVTPEQNKRALNFFLEHLGHK